MCHRVPARRQTGFSMPVAIFILVVMALIGTAMVQLVSTGHMSVANEALSTRAFYAAESGAQWGMNRLFPPTGSSCPATSCVASSSLTFTAAGLSGCSAVVVCTGLGTFSGREHYGLTSTGTCGSSETTATREIEVRAACEL